MTQSLQMINSPALLLDKAKCLANIGRMANRAQRHNLSLKPHFKTHQSAEIGEWFRDFGITAITVSSVDMAIYFARHDWRDITIAFPVNIREVERIGKLAQKLTLSLLVNDMDTASRLENRLSHPVSVYVEVDTGDRRSGVNPEDTDKLEDLINLFSASEILNFRGFYSHPGHSYSARSKEEIHSIHEEVLTTMQSLKKRFRDAGPVICCIGDTPCCSVAEDFNGIDEISPGNFVFYDLMQAQIGSCNIKDIAVALAAPVVAKQKERKEVIIHGGAIHLSKESIMWSDKKVYGLPVRLSEGSWPAPAEDNYLKSLSQEHGVLQCTKKLYSALNIGDLIGILPVHSCLSANLMKEYVVTEEISQNPR